MYATIGQDIETGQPITLGDIERRSGLYILGRTGMGKSWLLTNLILKDIEHGHGVFFLDPHGDAIEDIIARLPLERNKDVISLHPEHKTRSFGINLFACKDIHDSNEREATYTRARNVFSKIFESEWGSWGPWMQMALQNTLYAFIENQGYTLADVPQFLKNPVFRDHIVRNITHNPAVADFWRDDFSPVQAQSLSTRVNILLGHPPVNHIVGQRETTIDFAEIMDKRQILLVKLSANLSTDIKKFIGTILISELVHAARRRESIPVDKRHQFCIYIDEFQNFSNSEDFSILFTQARKYGIATTIAHQERYGQFADNKMILGATAAAANKIFFQLTVRDAEELAPEFAKPPPTETKLEQELVISQSPVSDLLRGHVNPKIREFVNQYLRPFQERLENIKDDMERERLIRDDFRDIAALGRVDAQIEALRERYSDPAYWRSQYVAQHAALARSERALEYARGQTEKLLNLHAQSRNRRETIRVFNKFYTAIMEGQIAQGQESFSQFLWECVRHSAVVSVMGAKVLELYISLLYGDPKMPRAIPVDFAKANRLFADTVTAIQHEAERKARREQEAFLKEAWETYHNECRKAEAYHQKYRQERQEAVLKVISASKLTFLDLAEQPAPYGDAPYGDYCSPGENPVRKYMLLHEYPSVAKIFEPYYTARFAPPWKGVFPDHTQTVSWMLDWVRFFRKLSLRGLEYFNYYSPAPESWRALRQRFLSGPGRDSCPKGATLFEIDLLDGFEQFVKQYGEGAIVVLALLMTLDEPTKWRRGWQSVHYESYHMLYLPTLVNREPLDIFLLLGRLADILPRLNIKGDCHKYTWWCPEYFEYDWMKGAPREHFTTWLIEDSFHKAHTWTRELKKLEERKDMQCLGQHLAQSRDPLARQRWWTNGVNSGAKLYH